MNRFLAALFPYRTHLEAEIEYLKTLLAQRTRRCDELQEALFKASERSTAKIIYKQDETGKMTRVQPKGWDEYRAYRRENPEAEENSDAVQGK